MKGNQPQEPPAAQFYKRKIGAYELIALSDGGLNYPTAMILGNVPPDGASQYDLPEGQMFIPYTLLLIRTEDNLVLNDVGAGDLGNPGDGIFPGLDHRTSRTNLLAPSMRAAGIDPGEIDTVLITHAHPDHVGGLLDAQGNLVFPNARYYVAQREWDYWMSAEPPTAGPEEQRKLIARRITTAKKDAECDHSARHPGARG